MTFPDFLYEAPFGEILLSGHRIGLYHVVHYYNDGFSPEMIAGQFPTLPLALVHKVIAFYLENRASVDAYVANCRRELDEQQQSRQGDLATLRKRLEAMQKQELQTSPVGRHGEARHHGSRPSRTTT